jgi:aminopeptidase N
MQVAVRNAGFKMGTRALVWALLWAVTREAIGREPAVEDVMEWWNESRATAFREQAAFRKAFPTLKTPALIWDNPDAQKYVKELVRRFKTAEAFAAADRRQFEQVAVDVGILPAV